MNEDKASDVSKQWMDLAPQLMRRMRGYVIESSVGTLTMPQYRILANINRGLNSVGEIAEHHGVAQPSMSKMINLMVERGLISRKVHQVDKRQSVLSLTQKGKTLFLKVRTKAQGQISKKLQGLESEDVLRLGTAFETIKQVLEKWT